MHRKDIVKSSSLLIMIRVRKTCQGQPQNMFLVSAANIIAQTKQTENANSNFGYGLLKIPTLNSEGFGKTHADTHRDWSRQFLKTLKWKQELKKRENGFWDFSIQFKESIPTQPMRLILTPPPSHS